MEILKVLNRTVQYIDDHHGSCFYEVSYNFPVYSGKKNHLGHWKTYHHEIYVYAVFRNYKCLAHDASNRHTNG